MSAYTSFFLFFSNHHDGYGMVMAWLDEGIFWLGVRRCGIPYPGLGAFALFVYYSIHLPLLFLFLFLVLRLAGVFGVFNEYIASRRRVILA